MGEREREGEGGEGGGGKKDMVYEYIFQFLPSSINIVILGSVIYVLNGSSTPLPTSSHSVAPAPPTTTNHTQSGLIIIDDNE